MTGLTEQEVRSRINQGLNNVQVSSSTRTVGQIVRDNVFTYFNLIFTILALLLVFVGAFKDLTFMLIIFANTAIGIFQEIKSKKTLDNLKLMKMPKIHALRDGCEVEVAVEDLVLGDYIFLGAGSQIPADAVVIKGSLQVNESLLTGEADEITKKEDSNLMSGSFVVSGQCIAKLTAVGRDSYISKLTLEATKEAGAETSEMIRSLDKLVKIIGVIIIPVGLILLIQGWLILGTGFRDSVIGMVAAVLGMIPEGLYMTASVAMMVSAIRLARKEVLVQNMKCIETLARVDVLCVDKTGTITENTMSVDDIHIIEGLDRESVIKKLRILVSNQSSDNITMEALKNHLNTGEKEGYVSKVCGFSSKYKYSGVETDGKSYVIGAPEYILGSTFEKYSGYIGEKAEEGYRVLAFGTTTENLDGQMLADPIDLEAFVLITNPIREGATKTFKFFEENEVEIKVISGDNPLTVSKVAEKAGIANAHKYVDATLLVDYQAVYEAVEVYTVFGRVTPEQKRMFVRALQEQGKTVGMTGDGVNDILALKDADCSIAMASGSEAASNAAQLVLMDSDFSRMPQVVSEGRRVVNNLEKGSSLYLTKNIFSLLLALFSVVNVLSYPLTPSQITLISMFTIGIPSFVLSLEPNNKKIKGSFLGNVFKMATPAGITTFISVSALVIFGLVFNISNVCISTSSTMLVALVGFMILIKVAKPDNRIHSILIIAMIIGMAYCVIYRPSTFGIMPITMQAGMLLVVFLMATEALFRYFYMITESFSNKLSYRKGKRSKRVLVKKKRKIKH